MTRTATDAARQIAAGALSAEQLHCEYSQRITEREHAIGAWEHLDVDGALQRARQLDAGPKLGLLHGIPIGVKDIIDVAGLPARYGTPIYADNVAGADAACIALAKASGAIVMGKTVSTELAWFQPGKTRNPHTLEHTPGGSSSGSAAAVAAGMVPLALGTQTAGSVIRPASYCGIVGFKPSFGVVPRAGVKSQSESLDTIGWMANCVADAALLAAALTGDEAMLAGAASTPPRIAVLELPEMGQASTDMRGAVNSALRIFARAGAKTSTIKLPEIFSQLNAAQHDIQLFEAGRAYFSEYSQHRGRLSERIVALLTEGRAISWQRYYAAQDLAASCRALMVDVFRDTDVLLLPAAPGAAPHGIGATGDPVFNRASTVLHLPAITLPRFKDGQGLPLGIQLLGPVRADAALLAQAAWAELQLAAARF